MQKIKPKILYISLTGMTEPLGRSQVLEYLIKLSEDYSITLLSFEREKDLPSLSQIEDLTSQYDITWHSYIYSNRFGVFSAIKQITSVTRDAYRLIKREKIALVHARSLIPAVIGMLLKKVTGAKLLFDIRGFATAEKVDTGRVKKGSILYHILLWIEKYLYRYSDHIVTLTRVSKQIIAEQFSTNVEKISVIPTCANSELFYSVSKEENEDFKNELGYNKNDKIIIHTGTVGGWYDFESEVKIFKNLLERNQNVKFLILNRDKGEFIGSMFNKYNIESKYYQVSSCALNEMYRYLNMADLALFLIHPSYSKKASTPTKFAENLACHLPSITNKGIGDMDYYLSEYDVGLLIELAKVDVSLEEISDRVVSLLQSSDIDNTGYNRAYNNYFNATQAVQRYSEIYNTLLGEE